MVAKIKIKKILKELKFNINKQKFTLEDLIKGIKVEMEHGKKHKLTNITNNDITLTLKIALAHLLEYPDYYKRLEK